MKVESEKVIPWAEVKKALEKKEKEKELSYEQKNALDHLRKFSKLSEKSAAELAEELGKIERLKERHIVSIINHMPQELEELRVLFANEVVSPSEEDRKKIISIVKKYA
ncbi:MAG TPA: DNA-directed RNA polymerase subunit F [archaeon]|nr:DNA-directed RNA polymerase subunit F [archaeon]